MPMVREKLEEQRKKGPKMKIRTVVYIILAIYAGLIFFNQTATMNKIKGNIGDLNKEKAVVEEKQDKLNKELENLNKDDYIEAIARKELGLIREGEEVFVDSGKEE